MKKTHLFGMTVIVATLLAIFSGCSSKQEEFNKPADYWYQKMVKETARGDLENADKTFTSLQSEHVGSPLISDAMLILAQAHMQNEEYILSNYYLDEFIKRYGDRQSVEFAKYLKVKANFFAFKKEYRDQQLLADTLRDSENFVKEYPRSVYRPFVETMIVKLALANKAIDENIAGLYNRIGKPDAAKKYREDANISWLRDVEYEKANTPWYRAIFEVQLQ